MNLQDVMEQGAICGLTTVDEAILNFELHAMQLLAYSEIPETVKKIREEYQAYIANGGSWDIPEDIIKKANDEMEEYFRAQEAQL